MTNYIAKVPNEKGIIDFTEEENGTWSILYRRQRDIIQQRACDEFVEGVETLRMSADHIPQIPDMNRVLHKITGWSVRAVPALIPIDEFFTLLANKQFPAATFIRTRAALDYLEEPDLFHEYFGHCPLLTNQTYADFLQWYGKLALQASEPERRLLARLFWFTIEFGLMQTKSGYRIYGGGILSSKGETLYAIESAVPERKPFVLEEVLRTPYRINIMQPIYYVIHEFKELYQFMEIGLMKYVDQAMVAGDLVPTFHTC